MKALFTIGDKVQLKSGGPEMTVRQNRETYLAFKEFKGEVWCTWFNGKKLETKLFIQETLQKV
ncbi:MAG TPA: DUF2158 domain-containing protein [Bacteroidia bacterium]|jgi:uncharacterized protein YodC (DUF2158 family)|nr:DUF2158 domain-containing protein [Bacteroidia bacterium]